MITMHQTIPLKQLFFTLLIASVVLTTASVLSAWTGPTVAPPNNNVPAPINVGATDQVKDASLGLNGLAVFGNAILSGTGLYFNFGSTAGSSGYGFRDSGGTMEFKNSGGSWGTFLQGGSSSSINDLGDVNAASPTDGQVLTYDGTATKWEAADLGGGGSGPVPTIVAGVNFSGGTGGVSVRDSYNISSVVRNGKGDYTINFSAALSDTSYLVLTNTAREDKAGGMTANIVGSTQTTTSVRINVRTATGGNAWDPEYAFVTIIDLTP
jgi:hypothetical protein